MTSPRQTGSATGEWSDVTRLPLRARRPTVARRAVLDVDVVLVSRCGRDRVLACLNSLAVGVDGAVQSVTVVDNGSNDGTCEAVASRGDGTRVLDMGFDAGMATAANAGMARGRGKYILILDQDTSLAPGSVRSLVEFADRHPHVGAVAPRLLTGEAPPSASGASDQPEFEVDWVPAQAMLVPRAVHAATAGFDESYFSSWADRDWCRRIKAAGYSVWCLPSATAVHQDPPPPTDRSERRAMARSFYAGAYRYCLQYNGRSRWHPWRWTQVLPLAVRGRLAVSAMRPPPTIWH